MDLALCDLLGKVSRLKALVYHILPPATAITPYAIGLSASDINKGLPLQAMFCHGFSDFALWDLLGKVSSGLQHVSSNHRLNWLRHSSPKTQLFLLTVFRWNSDGSKCVFIHLP